MSKEDYVSLEVAKLLKEKGFNEYCGAYYHLNWEDMTEEECFEVSPNHDFRNKDNGYRAGAPTLYEAAKWLRNKYDINVFVFTCLPCCFDNLKEYDDTRYTPCVVYNKKDGKKLMCLHRNLTDFYYEKVYNAGILEALKLI